MACQIFGLGQMMTEEHYKVEGKEDFMVAEILTGKDIAIVSCVFQISPFALARNLLFANSFIVGPLRSYVVQSNVSHGCIY